MLCTRLLVGVIAVLAASAVGSAQITQIPPFAGQVLEGFETQPSLQFDPCVVGRVFQNQADLCTPMCVCATIQSSWGGSCTVLPHTGNFLATALAGPLVFAFDRPVTRIGGYFASAANVPDAFVVLYGPCQVQLASFSLPLASGCGWTWYGFQSGAMPIESMSIETFTGLGSHVQIDSFQADFTSPLPSPVIYCTAKVNSLGCLPAIHYQGRSSSCCGQGFLVSASLVRNNKVGLLLYGVSGAASLPFSGGILCVRSPVQRTVPVQSGGNPLPANDCSGQYAIDFNAFAVGALGGTPATVLVVPGTAVNAQWWGRDQGFPPPNNATLSDAIAFIVGWGC